ncbi:tRNA1(Val) (adenine(37)-N6)-methyltransferase [Namhaeicola litoreus]|uniref:tRNA1(Val) (adenine(37)-N6)-methyltransferase n=1 Tax=Namhaeicola litoreus TaxID=1052145 RepID=A0ABW3XXS9_9FLAO
MSQKPFQFKEFTVQQDKCAMKIGTDGVLLGAWCEVNNAESILDIGTGTGLIALMLAQRSDAELIDAIEIEPEAYEQAVENFENSPWGDRLFCYHASVQEFAEEMDEKYDLIVSNPPYFQRDEQIEGKRQMARQSVSLGYVDLILATSKLLSQSGHASFIIPFAKEGEFLKIAREQGLFSSRITRVKGTATASTKRSLITLSFAEMKTQTEELILEKERHQYTDAYKEMVQDFYLNL